MYVRLYVQHTPSIQGSWLHQWGPHHAGLQSHVYCTGYTLTRFLRSVFQPEIDSGNHCFRFQASGSMDPRSIALLMWHSDTLAMICVWTQTLLVSRPVALTCGWRRLDRRIALLVQISLPATYCYPHRHRNPPLRVIPAVGQHFWRRYQATLDDCWLFHNKGCWNLPSATQIGYCSVDQRGAKIKRPRILFPCLFRWTMILPL
jgi:hypothetical protein